MKVQELKQEIKDLAVKIKELKSLRKDTELRRNDPRCKWGSGYVEGLERARYEVRHKHIAYCLFRGTLLTDIEPSRREDNAPNMTYVRDILSTIEPREVVEHEETVCCG